MANFWQNVATWLNGPREAPDLETALAYTPESLRSYIQGPLTASALMSIVEGRTSSTGAAVNEWTALNLSAVWCAVQNIAGTVGSLPLILYKRLSDGAGKERYVDHPLYRLLHDEPNPEMSAMVFRETLQAHVLLWGNGYAEIQRDKSSRVSALWPITPNRVTPKRTLDSRRALYYEVHNEDKAPTRLAPADVLHIPGLGFDGTMGYSVVGKARSTLRLGMETEHFGNSLFAYGPKWSGILQHPKTMSREAKQALRADLKALDTNDFAMLEEGLEWVSTGMPAKDAEFLATRQFQVTEIARWFNMPPHKLKDLMRATFSNIEHQGIDYLTDTLRPWLVRWEQEINRKLVAPLERRSQFAEHLVDALLRGDTASRHAAYASGIQWGWMNRDEVREKENMNPMPNGEGKVFLVPANMLPADKVGELAAPPPPRATDEPPAEPEPRALPPAPDYAASAARMLDATLAAIERERADRPEAPTADPPASPPEHVPPIDRGQLITAHRAMVAEMVGRMTRQEAYKARRASRSPERLRAWIGDFYQKHAEKFAQALLPAARSHLAMLPDGSDPNEYTRALVAEHVEASRRELHALLDAKPDDLSTAVDDLVSRWEIERPGLIADRIMQEEIQHV